MTNLLKNLMFALGLVIVIFLGYQVFLAKPSLEDSVVTGQAEAETQAFLARLNEIRSIDIDDTFFTDIRFVSLVDFRVELEDEPAGRENPFAPVE